MVQLQALNYILKNKDSDLLTTYGPEYYFNYEKEYKCIRDHFDKTGEVMDILQMLEHFPDFTVLPETASISYHKYQIQDSKSSIEDKLVEEYAYHFTKTFFDTHDISDPKVKEDFIRAVKKHGGQQL